MKTLISAQTIEEAMARGQEEIAIDPQTIITPQARDMAAKAGLRFIEKAPLPSGGDDLTAERIYKCLSALLATGSLQQDFLDQLQAISAPLGLHIEQVQELNLPINGQGRFLHEKALKTLRHEVFAIDRKGKTYSAQKETVLTVISGEVEICTAGYRCQLAVGDSFALSAGMTLTMKASDEARLTATMVR